MLLYILYITFPIWIGLRSFLVLDGEEKWVGLGVLIVGSLSLLELTLNNLLPFYSQPYNGWYDVLLGFQSIVEDLKTPGWGYYYH